jgi:hypothetical protein
MTYVSQSSITENKLGAAPASSRKAGGLLLASRITSMVKWISDYADAIADHHAAWTMYEQLSRLSDAELRHRGLSRENLARDVLSTQCREW